MELVVPWKALLNVTEPFYLTDGWRRRPVSVGIDAASYLMQSWSALSEPGDGGSPVRAASLSNFAGLNLSSRS